LKRVILGLFAVLIALSSSLPANAFLFGSSGGERLLYVKQHFGATWYFYTDKVVVSYQGENITLYNIIGDILGYQLLEANATHVVLYSNITLGTFYITILFDYKFSPFIPQAKYSSYILSNLYIPRWLNHMLKIRVEFPEQPRGHNHTWRGGRFWFSSWDLDRHHVNYNPSLSGNTLTLSIPLSGYRIDVDPAIGYTSGESNVTTFVYKYGESGYSDYQQDTVSNTLTLNVSNVPLNNHIKLEADISYQAAYDNWVKVWFYAYNYTLGDWQQLHYSGELSGNPTEYTWETQLSSINDFVSGGIIKFKVTIGETVGFEQGEDTFAVNLKAWVYGQYTSKLSYQAYSDSNATYTYNITSSITETSSRLLLPITITGGAADYVLQLNLTGAIPDGYNLQGFQTQDGADIPYWVEHAYDSVYIRLPQNGNYTIYAVLGGSIDYGSKSSIYILFDDFEADTGWVWSSKGSFSWSYSTDTYVSPSHSYKISYPSSTASAAGYYGAISRNITVSQDETVQITFYQTDSYTGSTSGYHYKQLLVDGNVVWEEDVAGGTTDFTEEAVTVSLTAGTHTVTLRVYDKRGVSNFHVDVYFDDIAIQGYTDSKPSYTIGKPFNQTLTRTLDMAGLGGYLYVPIGYKLTYNNTGYTLEAYNTTHNKLSFTMPSGYALFNFTAWNSLSISTDAQYYPYNSPINVTVRLLDPYGNPIPNQTVKLWLGADYTNIQTTTLTQSNVHLSGGTILAPHLYNWYFSGGDINLGVLGDQQYNNMLIESRIRFIDYNISKWYTLAEYQKYGSNGFWWGKMAGSNNIYFYLWSNGTLRNYKVYMTVNMNQWMTWTTIYNGTDIMHYVNGTQIGDYHYSGFLPVRLDPTRAYSISNLVNPFNGFIAYQLLYVNYTEQPRINTNIINAKDTRIFLDPTFYDGSNYVDLLNSSVKGTPYGGVARVRANDTWLWVVSNARNDSLIHLDWFPVGSRLYFYQNGQLVRDVFIGSNHETVSLPAGVYNVTAVVPEAEGNYTSAMVTTDNNGYASYLFENVNYDARIIVQGEYNGTYVGVANKTVYSTGLGYDLSYPSYVYRGGNASISLRVWHTVDNSSFNGYAYFTDNQRVIAVNPLPLTKGFGSAGVRSNVSGEYSFTLTTIKDLDNGFTYKVGGGYNYTVMGVDISVTVTPVKYFYLVNETVNINISLAYDTGQTRQWKYQLLLYQDGELRLNQTLKGYNTMLEFNVAYNNTLVIRVTEADNTTVTSKTVYIPALSITLSAVTVATSDNRTVAYVGIKQSGGVIGSYYLGMYGVRGTGVTELKGNTFTVQIYWRNADTTNVSLDLVFTNLKPNIRNASITLTLRPVYYGDTANTTVSLTVYGYQIAYRSISLLVPEFFIGKILRYNVTVILDGENASFTGFAPLLVGYGVYRGVSVVSGFADSSSTWRALAIQGEASNVTLQIATAIGLYSPSPAVVNTTGAKGFVSVSIPSILFETGETGEAVVTVNSPVPVNVTVTLEGSKITEFTAVGNTSRMVRFTVPNAPPYTLLKYAVNAEATLGDWVIASDTGYLQVYNTGPSITLVSPAEYSTLNGTVNFTLYVSDESGVAMVSYQFDDEGDTWHNATILPDGAVVFSVNTLEHGNGLIHLIVKAQDKQGFITQESYAFYIENPEKSAKLFSTWYNIGLKLQRWIMLPALITSVLSMVIGAIAYHFLSKLWRKRQKPQVIIVKEGGGRK